MHPNALHSSSPQVAAGRSVGGVRESQARVTARYNLLAILNRCATAVILGVLILEARLERRIRPRLGVVIRSGDRRVLAMMPAAGLGRSRSGSSTDVIELT